MGFTARFISTLFALQFLHIGIFAESCTCSPASESCACERDSGESQHQDSLDLVERVPRPSFIKRDDDDDHKLCFCHNRRCSCLGDDNDFLQRIASARKFRGSSKPLKHEKQKKVHVTKTSIVKKESKRGVSTVPLSVVLSDTTIPMEIALKTKRSPVLSSQAAETPTAASTADRVVSCYAKRDKDGKAFQKTGSQVEESFDCEDFQQESRNGSANDGSVASIVFSFHEASFALPMHSPVSTTVSVSKSQKQSVAGTELVGDCSDKTQPVVDACLRLWKRELDSRCSASDYQCRCGYLDRMSGCFETCPFDKRRHDVAIRKNYACNVAYAKPTARPVPGIAATVTWAETHRGILYSNADVVTVWTNSAGVAVTPRVSVSHGAYETKTYTMNAEPTCGAGTNLNAPVAGGVVGLAALALGLAL